MTETSVNNSSVLKQWAAAFPELGKYGTKYLLRVWGPVAVGIELLKIFPTTYRPEAVLINLADTEYPRPVTVVHQFLRGQNRVQMAIAFDKHYFLFDPATQAMRAQAATVVDPHASLIDMIEWILRFLNEDYVGGTNTFQEFKAVMMLSKLLRDEKKGAEYFAAATRGLQEMPQWILDAETNGFDSWLERLKGTGPKELVDNVHKNIERWKMTRLPSSSSLPDML